MGSTDLLRVILWFVGKEEDDEDHEAVNHSIVLHNLVLHG